MAVYQLWDFTMYRRPFRSALLRCAAHQNSLMWKVLVWSSLKLSRFSPRCEDVRGKADHPINAVYLSPDRRLVLDVHLDHCRGLHSAAFDCSESGNHPFVLTLKCLGAGLYDDYRGSPLDAYYKSWQPRHAADVLGLDEAEAHPRLSKGTPMASALPWDYRTPDEHEEFWIGAAAADYEANGFSIDLSHGWKAWGPMPPAAVETEFMRLSRVYQSVKKDGYRRHPAHDGDIEGEVLMRGRDFRVLLGAGQHRAAALAALEFASAPVRLSPVIIRREDVDYWPNVIRGYFTREQAIAVFDRIFDGRQPFVATPPGEATEAGSSSSARSSHRSNVSKAS